MITAAIVGCGSVSRHYLEELAPARYVRVAAVCDCDRERAAARAAEFDVPAVFGDVGELLSECTFDLLINLTAMPAHFAVNMAGLRAGRHVLSEKPMATSFGQGQALVQEAEARGVLLLAAPSCCASPAFAALRDVVRSGEIGEVYTAHGRYGHPGPDWGPWFYGPEGGPIYDLAVYNLTFLTGLLGPARAVAAMTATAVPERVVDGERIRAACEDNAAILLDHGEGVLTSVQAGFVYGPHRGDWSVELIGTRGAAYLLGWDWEPQGISVWSDRYPRGQTRAQDQKGYSWRNCARIAAERIAGGRPGAMDARHALHVLEIMDHARESGRTGARMTITTPFDPY